jgi:serine/threonine-protein kinase
MITLFLLELFEWWTRGRRRQPPPISAPNAAALDTTSDHQQDTARSSGPSPQAATFYAEAPRQRRQFRDFTFLGAGGYAKVYSALEHGQPVAIKWVSGAQNPKALETELRAAELCIHLKHENLVRLLDYYLFPENLFLVMEKGVKTLGDYDRELRESSGQGIPLTELLGYVTGMAAGLDYLHGHDIAHRDIKPSNVMLFGADHAFCAKIADFGIARELSGDAYTTLLGTPAYLAPEGWCRRFRFAADQYSLAATYAELRLGRPLFSSPTSAGQAVMHQCIVPNLDELPRPERRVLLRALSKRPRDRFRSCSRFARALTAAVHCESVTREPKFVAGALEVSKH